MAFHDHKQSPSGVEVWQQLQRLTATVLVMVRNFTENNTDLGKKIKDFTKAFWPCRNNNNSRKCKTQLLITQKTHTCLHIKCQMWNAYRWETPFMFSCAGQLFQSLFVHLKYKVIIKCYKSHLTWMDCKLFLVNTIFLNSHGTPEE